MLIDTAKICSLFAGLFLINTLLYSQSLSGNCPDRDSVLKSISAANPSDSSQLTYWLKLESKITACQLNNTIVHFKVLDLISRFYFKESLFDKAVHWSQQSISVLPVGDPKPGDYQRILSNSYYLLQAGYDSLHNQDMKMRMIDSCLAVETRAGKDYYNSMYLIGDKVEWLFNKGDYRACINYANTGEALIQKYYKESDSLHRTIFMTIYKIQAHMFLDELDAAEAIIQSRIKDYKKLKSIEFVGTMNLVYATLHLNKNLPEEAIDNLNVANKINKEIRNNKGCAEGYGRMAEIYLQNFNQVNNAIKYAMIALQYADATDSMFLLTTISKAHIRNNHPDDALRSISLGFNVTGLNLQEEKFTDVTIDSKLLGKRAEYITGLVITKADAYLAKGKLFHDKTSLNQAAVLYRAADILLSNLKSQQKEFDSKLFWRKHTTSLYENAIEACYLIGDINKSLFFFEKSRAILLQDQINDRLKQNTVSTTSKKANTSIRFETMVKDLLKTHRAFIEIFNGDSAVYILMYHQKGARHSKINKDRYDELVADFQKGLIRPIEYKKDFILWTKQSQALYKLIFENDKVEPGRIIVSPGSIQFPFEALIVSNNNGKNKFLLEDYAVSYTYSATFLGSGEKIIQKTGHQNFLGVAPMRYAPAMNLSELKGSDVSINRIGSNFSGYQKMISTDATKMSFLDNFYKYDIVHLYTHADAKGMNNEPVIFFMDSVLDLNDLTIQQQPVTSLIVLAACESGLGKFYEGEGVFSFNRAFAAIGIPTSIVNLWPVDNKTTYALNELFYKFLEQGETADMALRKAKLEFLETALGENAMPYYWAGTVVAGKNFLIANRSTGIFWELGIAIAFVLLILIFVWWGRTRTSD